MSNGEEIDESALLAYLNKELSQEDMMKVDLWITRSPENMQKFNDIRDTWKMAGSLKVKPVDVDVDHAWNSVLNQIDTSSEGVIQMKPKTNRRLVIGIAAAFAVLVALSTVFLFNSNQPIQNSQLELVSTGSVVSEQLADGSEVTLNENSVLSYPAEFGEDERRVSLKGEGYFDIARDEAKPFVIDLPEGAYVKVLGTSFNIQANDEEEITEVFVHSGKVEFGSEKDKMILEAGEKAILNEETGQIEKIVEEVFETEELYWIDKNLNFEGETLDQVVDILNNVYVDRVFLECDQLENEPINSNHQNESLDDVLSVLQATHGFEIEKIQSESGTEYYLRCDG